MSCSSPKPPDWIYTQPENTDYWFGYGIVAKPFSGDIREEARNRAIEEIAAQISIQISSQMENLITEHNYDVNEFTRSLTETRINSNLENIEISKTYNDKEEFILLAKLSRQKYYETVQKQRRNAVETALGLVRQADENFKGATFTLLDQAINEISNYMDEPIFVEYPVGSGLSVQLYPLLKLKISELLNRISLKVSPNRVTSVIGIPDINVISVQVIDVETGNPIPDIPLTWSMTSPTDYLIYSDEHGEAGFTLPVIVDKTPVQPFNIIVKVDMLISSGSYKNIQSFALIHAASPVISIQSSERNLGNIMDISAITEGVKQVFQELYGAEFTTDLGGDIILNINANTQKRSNSVNEYGLFVTYGNVNISISTQSGNEIFSTTLTGEMGRSFSNHEDSGLDAIQNMKEKILSQLKPELEKVFSR